MSKAARARDEALTSWILGWKLSTYPTWPGYRNGMAAYSIEAASRTSSSAAVTNEPAPFWRVPRSVLREVMATNVLGTGYTVQAFVPTMISRGKGLIINVSSGWGRSVAAEMAPYWASKWAIEALTRSLARELPAGMAAVTLNPGIVRTEMLRICWPTRAEADYEMPDVWVNRAAKLILSLSAADNGRQVTVPPP